MALMPVAEALRLVLASLPGVVETETVAIPDAIGRTLSDDLRATRDQPPFAASAMDGYAVRGSDLVRLPAALRVVGASVAGRRHPGALKAGEAIRIFTGAAIPEDADTIVIQENTTADGERVIIREADAPGRYIRPAGLDFRAGTTLLKAGDHLDARRITLAAAAGPGTLRVRRRPRIALLATGDELVPPGGRPGDDQIFASNPYGLRAIVERAGGEAIDLGIARDDLGDLAQRIDAARGLGCDVLVTLGGASVGEHDLVQEALVSAGMELGFWRVALRPGKPLMHGRLGPMMLLGLPGNPVSSLVCAILFLVPALRTLLGDPSAGADQTEAAILGADLPANDGRQDYMRAALEIGVDGFPWVTADPRQDSSMLAVLASSQALIVREPHAPALASGETCRIIRLDRFV